MKLKYHRTFFVGLAFMSICAFWQVYDGIIPLILKNHFQIGDFASGWVMAIDNILALFMLPLFGLLSDKVKTPIGRRMPFILGGTAMACIMILIIPYAANQRNLLMFFIGLGVVLFAMATYRSPAVALMPDVTPKPLRSMANAVINLMGAVGGLLMLGAIAFLVPKTALPDYTVLFVVTLILMALCVAILFFTIKEPACALQMRQDSAAMGIAEETASKGTGSKMDKAVFKSFMFILVSIFFWFMGYNAVTTSFSKYAVHSWGLEGGAYATVLLVAQAAAIVSYIPVGILASKVGRKKTILAGITMLALAFAAALFFKSFSSIIFLFFAFAGVGWAFINVNSYPMVVEMSNGADIGKYTGYYYTVSMTAQIITPIVSGWFLENVGYNTLFPYGAFFVALSFVTMLFVKHGDSKPQPKKKLEAFDVDD